MKKFLTFICFTFLFCITNVYAENVNTNLYPNLVMPTGVKFYGWSSATDYYELGTAYLSGDEDANGNKYTYYYTSSNAYNDVNGFSIYFDLPGTIPKNTNISMDLVFCNTNSNNYFNGSRTYGIGTAVGSTLGDNYSPNNSYWYSLGTLNTAANNFTCRRFSINFTTPVGGTRFAYRIKSTSTIALGTLAFMGIASSNYGFDYSNQFENIDSSIGDMVDQQEQTNEKLDDTNEKLDDTNEKLDELENTITDESAPNKIGNLSDSAGWLPAGPVDSILNLPLTMFQNLSNNIGKSCTPLTITLPYLEEDITLPCLNSIYEQIDGLSVWINSVGIIASAFILYSYLLKLYKWVDDTLTFRENNHIDNWGGI